VFFNADGTRICWEYMHTCVVTDQWPASTNRPAVGTKLEIPILLSCDCSDGKLVKIREYFDMWSIIDPGSQHRLYS
jgi:hypothetical protein